MELSPNTFLLLGSLGLGLSIALLVGWTGPAWDLLTGRMTGELTPRLRELRIDQQNVPFYLRWWGISMVATFIIFGFLFSMYPIAMMLIYLIYVTPKIVLNYLIKKRSYKLRDQMVGASIALANSCRAGLNLPQALKTLSLEAPEPLRQEFRVIIRDYENGRPLDEAILETKRRLNLDGFTLFASAILICMERGGKITEALERISLSLQENQRLERKLEADTQAGRRMVGILAAFPFVFLGMFYLVEPQGTSLMFTTIIGQILFVLIGLLVWICVRWSDRIFASVDI